jgi:hypothetical protein
VVESCLWRPLGLARRDKEQDEEPDALHG